MNAVDIVRAEALRNVPALISAHRRNDFTGSRFLFQTYFETALDAGLDPCAAWGILFTAALHWTMSTTEQIADMAEVDADEVILDMASRAAIWAGSHAG